MKDLNLLPEVQSVVKDILEVEMKKLSKRFDSATVGNRTKLN